MPPTATRAASGWLSSCKDFFAQRALNMTFLHLALRRVHPLRCDSPRPRLPANPHGRRVHHPIPVCSPSPSALFI